MNNWQLTVLASTAMACATYLGGIVIQQKPVVEHEYYQLSGTNSIEKLVRVNPRTGKAEYIASGSIQSFPTMAEMPGDK